MPTVLRAGPYRFFFYAGDQDEPPHVHVERDASVVKFWLDPIMLERSSGFDRRELGIIRRRIEEHHSQLLETWHGYFNR